MSEWMAKECVSKLGEQACLDMWLNVWYKFCFCFALMIAKTKQQNKVQKKKIYIKKKKKKKKKKEENTAVPNSFYSKV